MSGADYDFAVVGSGFGGSVAALRLAEKGYRVVVLEQGRRLGDEDLAAGGQRVRDYFWMPRLGMRGYFTQTVLRHVGIIGGVGVGGGSLVYAAVLLTPDRHYFQDPRWRHLHPDWEAALRPHYATARRMLGQTPNRARAEQDRYLEATARALGAGDSFGDVDLGIYFGWPGVTVPDPFFDGAGPPRTGCRHCGACLTGCPYNAKNSLDKNYLYLAERLGAEILPEREVRTIQPTEDGYAIAARHPFTRRPYPLLRARRVVLAAGVLGTLRILFRSRDDAGTLPHVSRRLGEVVRTNSEALVAVVHPAGTPNLTTGGPTITTHFYPDERTHITQNRIAPGYDFMRWYLGPLVDDHRPVRRALRTLGTALRHPRRATSSWRGKQWHERTTVLSTMQNVDNRLSLTWGRSLLAGGRRDLRSAAPAGSRPPTFLPAANAAARAYARAAGGVPLNYLPESIGNLSITAHVLGGCHMGTSADDGVINSDHELFNYPGIFVVDGAAVTANVGVNPSLTITAMAERAMAAIPPRPS